MKLIFRCLLVWLAVHASCANAEIFVALGKGARAGDADFSVDVSVLNSGTDKVELVLPPMINARLLKAQRSWPVELHARQESGPVTLPPQGFVRRTYVFTPPMDAAGQTILEIDTPAAAQGVVELATGSQDEAPAASRIERGFSNRFAFHEPMYFIYGPEAPAAKFQFSFKYRLIGDGNAHPQTPARRGFYLAYTQRSLWDVGAASSPFFDTSYMPQMFFEWLAPQTSSTWFHWLGWQAGLQHESNGKAGAESRSLNTAYVLPGFAFGALDGWHLLVSPKVFAYISRAKENADIAQYRGHGDLQLTFGTNDGWQLGVDTVIGNQARKGSVQIDVTHPVRIPLIGLETYLLLQYFDGYGESLRTYDQKTSIWRFGISLVR